MANGFEQSLKAVSDRILGVAKERGVLGDPLTVGDTSILPLSEIKLGFGGGGGEGQGEGEVSASEGGAGKAAFGFSAGGVRVTPLALVIVTDDDVILEGFEEGGAK